MLRACIKWKSVIFLAKKRRKIRYFFKRQMFYLCSDNSIRVMSETVEHFRCFLFYWLGGVGGDELFMCPYYVPTDTQVLGDESSLTRLKSIPWSRIPIQGRSLSLHFIISPLKLYYITLPCCIYGVSIKWKITIKDGQETKIVSDSIWRL